ncbi:MAG: hypothetical protein IK005_10125 [Paludibacteraceae bacterium]|nr:hypothetical protein [Paludibacteraceae bacterium]
MITSILKLLTVLLSISAFFVPIVGLWAYHQENSIWFYCTSAICLIVYILSLVAAGFLYYKYSEARGGAMTSAIIFGFALLSLILACYFKKESASALDLLLLASCFNGCFLIFDLGALGNLIKH